MVTAEWKSQKWQVNKNIIRGIEEINMSVEARTETDKENNTTKCVGRTLEKLEISFSTAIGGGGNPKKEQDELQSLCGKSAPFYCGENQLGDNDFILERVDMSEGTLNLKGDILASKFSLSFIEDSSQQEKEGVKENKSKIKINYEGSDIFPKISVYGLTYTQYAENHADVLEIQFNDTGKNWNKWDSGKMKNTEISVEAEGVKTGKMFVYSCEPKNGLFNLKALSVPNDYNSTATKSWEKVTLEDIGQEIAGKHNLGFKKYNTKGIKRKYVHQDNEGDFTFLKNRCELEGACFVVYDGTLNLYDEKEFESGNNAVEINIDDEKFTSIIPTEKVNLAIGEYTVKNARFEGKATDSNYTLTKTEVIDEPMESNSDCENVAKAFLRKKNKEINTIEIRTDLQKGVSAGSVIDCKSKKKPTWNTKLFVYKLRHDFVANKSTIWARKPLNY